MKRPGKISSFVALVAAIVALVGVAVVQTQAAPSDDKGDRTKCSDCTGITLTQLGF